jgi:hypothetical protein
VTSRVQKRFIKRRKGGTGEIHKGECGQLRINVERGNSNPGSDTELERTREHNI